MVAGPNARRAFDATAQGGRLRYNVKGAAADGEGVGRTEVPFSLSGRHYRGAHLEQWPDLSKVEGDWAELA